MISSKVKRAMMKRMRVMMLLLFWIGKMIFLIIMMLRIMKIMMRKLNLRRHTEMMK